MSAYEITTSRTIPVAEVRRLFRSVGWHGEADLPDANLEQAFHRDAIVASAWLNDHLVGFVRAKVDGMYVVLFNLVIHPDHQRRGLAGDLFDTICDAARLVPGTFGVIGHANRAGRDFYGRHGGLLYVTELEIISTREDI